MNRRARTDAGAEGSLGKRWSIHYRLSVSSVRRLCIVAAILAVTIATDQVSKAWAESALDNGRSISLLPTLEFDLLYNTGFSFGTGQGRGQFIGLLVIAMSLYLVFQIWRATSPHRIVLFAVILGGAIGNLIDRIVRADRGLLSGSVVDFVDVSWFAVFNVADIYVVCGALAFAIWESLAPPRPSAASSSAASSSAAPSSAAPLTEPDDASSSGGAADEQPTNHSPAYQE